MGYSAPGAQRLQYPRKKGHGYSKCKLQYGFPSTELNWILPHYLTQNTLPNENKTIVHNNNCILVFALYRDLRIKTKYSEISPKIQ